MDFVRSPVHIFATSSKYGIHLQTCANLCHSLGYKNFLIAVMPCPVRRLFCDINTLVNVSKYSRNGIDVGKNPTSC